MKKRISSKRNLHQSDSQKKPLENEPHIQGTIIVHPRGFGFVNRKAPLQDVFIPKHMINGAVDGDTVSIELFEGSKSTKGPEGRVVSIKTRARSHVVGTVANHFDKKCEVFAPLLGPQSSVVCVLEKKSDCKIGDRVSVEILQWGHKEKPAEGKIINVIGSVNTPADDIPYILAETELRQKFPQEAIDQARQYGKRVTPKDIEGRVDLRTCECVTIDPDTAKDFDDAVSVEEGQNSFRVGVHIADVSYYVHEGSPLDKEAYLRCNSTYFPNTCIPMLPGELSENLCSLKPNVARLAVSVFFTVDHEGHTSDWKIERTVIKSKKRFSYKEAKQVLDGTTASPFAPLLHRMVNVCKLLKLDRKRRGSVELYVPELLIRIDDKGNPVGTEVVEYDITHQMIEEFMLKANEIVAIELKNRGKNVSYRVHEEPDEDSLRDFSTLVNAYGFSLPLLPSSHDIQKFFYENEKSPHAPYLAISYIKSMRLAVYSPDNIGHYGLGLEHYCHFTSPIRRYIDIVIHRLLLEEGATKEILEEICSTASDKERISAKAEGSVLKIKKLRYLQAMFKENPDRQYKGIITRVKPFGIYFDIQELMLEGFLHVSNLGDDYYAYDDSRTKLIGTRYGDEFFAGNAVYVRLVEIDLILGEAQWVLE